MNKPNLYFRAVLAQAQAKRAEALAVLDTYFQRTVGIGEHPQMVEEASRYLDQLAAADDQIATLKRYFDHSANLLDQE
jgi:hypothetical protein